MGYLTNYEPYTSQCQSLDLKRRGPSEEVISPLRTLYPHVAALQIQSDANAGYFTGYQHTGYWAEAYTVQPPGEDYSRPMTRRHSDSSTVCRFVSKIRRFLGRDDMGRRLNSVP